MTGCCLLTSVNAFEDPACKRFGTLERIPIGSNRDALYIL